MDKKVQWSLAGAVWVLALGALALGWLFLQKVPALSPGRGADSAQAGQTGLTGSRLLDPVTKTEVLIAADTPHVNYQGRDYYFSTARDERGRDHKTLFLMDPELYLNGVSSYKGMAATPAAPEPLSRATKAP
jgi:YHS domain-containing protein